MDKVIAGECCGCAEEVSTAGTRPSNTLVVCDECGRVFCGECTYDFGCESLCINCVNGIDTDE